MKRHSFFVALELIGTVGLIVGLTVVTEPYRGCGMSLPKPPPPVCTTRQPGLSPEAVAEAITRNSPDWHLLRADDRAAVLIGGPVVIVLGAEAPLDSGAIRDALSFSQKFDAAMKDHPALIVWLGRGQEKNPDATRLPDWYGDVRLALTHDDVTPEGCLVRVTAAEAAAPHLSNEKLNENAEKIARAEKVLVAAIGRVRPAPHALAARIEGDQQLMRDEAIWSSRTKGFPTSAIVILGLVFLFYWRAASDDDDAFSVAQIEVKVLKRDGALCVPPESGHRYRFLSYGLLHSGAQHLLNNSVSLYLGCYLLEPTIGAARTILIFVGGVVGGGAARLLKKQPGLLVGASGGSFALNGALLVLVLLPGGWVPAVERQGVEIFMAIILGAGLLLSFMPNISMMCHLGGAFAGAALAGLLTLGLPPLGDESRLAVIAWWILAGIACAALAFSGWWVRRLGRRASKSSEAAS